MWSSFRNHDDALNKAYNKMKILNPCSWAFLTALSEYLNIKIMQTFQSLQKPDYLTMIYAVFLLFFQLACILYAVIFTGRDNYLVVVAVLIICTLNIFLVGEIAVLFVPMIAKTFGTRPEYYFALIGLILVVSTSIIHSTSLFTYYMIEVTPSTAVNSNLPPLCCATTDYSQTWNYQQCKSAADSSIGNVTSCSLCAMYQCVDWAVGSTTNAQRELSFYKATGQSVYFGVGSFGNNQSNAGLCYRLSLQGLSVSECVLVCDYKKVLLFIVSIYNRKE